MNSIGLLVNFICFISLSYIVYYTKFKIYHNNTILKSLTSVIINISLRFYRVFYNIQYKVLNNDNNYICINIYFYKTILILAT